MQKSKDGDRLELGVEFKDADDAEQVATGIVMVPNKVDLQGDFVEPDTIRQFAEQFGNFEEVGEGGGGIMHAVWPDDAIALERNEVLDEATEIGGETAPADAWVQSWHFADDELWGLVSDGILDGYSIGAVNVDFGGPFGPDDVPDDVDVPDDHPDGEPVWHLRDGLIREVSAVDIPAVPDALILETKSDEEAMKRLSDHLGDRDGFVDEAMERGHTEAEAERLWNVLDRFASLEGSGEPGTSKSAFARAGKAFLDALAWSSDAGGHDGSDDASTASDPTTLADKESRTLSEDNRDRLMAAHDAVEDALASDVDFQQNRFSDDPGVDFDVADYSGKAAPTDADDSATSLSKANVVGANVFRVVAPGDSDVDYDGDLLGMGVDFPEHDVYVDWRNEAFPNELEHPHVSIYGSIDDLEQATGNVIEPLDTVSSPTDTLAAMAQRVHSRSAGGEKHSSAKHAPDGDTSDKNTTDIDMSDDDPLADAPEWAKAIYDDVEENSKAVADIRDELGKSDEGDDPDDPEKAWEDAPEWAKQLRAEQNELAEDMETLAADAGKSHQLGGETDPDDDRTSGEKGMSELEGLMG